MQMETELWLHLGLNCFVEWVVNNKIGVAVLVLEKPVMGKNPQAERAFLRAVAKLLGVAEDDQAERIFFIRDKETKKEALIIRRASNE